MEYLYAAVNIPNYSVLANCILHLSTGTVKVRVDAHSTYGPNVMICPPPLLGATAVVVGSLLVHCNAFNRNFTLQVNVSQC